MRRRFHQQSVLTFDYPDRRSDPVDAVELEVPGVSARRLRDGFAADEDARERLLGGSVTLDHRLILIAPLRDLGLPSGSRARSAAGSRTPGSGAATGSSSAEIP